MTLMRVFSTATALCLFAANASAVPVSVSISGVFEGSSLSGLPDGTPVTGSVIYDTDDISPTGPSSLSLGLGGGTEPGDEGSFVFNFAGLSFDQTDDPAYSAFGLPTVEFVDGALVGFNYGVSGLDLFGETNLEFNTIAPGAVGGSLLSFTAEFGADQDGFIVPENRLASAQLIFGEPVEISPIPLPAGGVLLLTALSGLALAKRRKETDV